MRHPDGPEPDRARTRDGGMAAAALTRAAALKRPGRAVALGLVLLASRVLAQAPAPAPDAQRPALSALIERAAPGIVTIVLPSGAVGSAFVVRADAGIILSAKHLVAKQPLTIRFQDESVWPAAIVGVHPSADLAALRVDAKAPLTALPMGDSRRLQVGEWIVALGNPFGLGLTASAGIIGATGRSLGSSAPDLVQTDAAINPGNSGGPLLNLRGEVVAVATAAVSVGQGIGFAVPIHLAEPLLARR
jgi:S1-C subfamily serine protease